MPNQKPNLFHQPQMISTLEFMGTPGQFFYIPAYQRDFSWSDENFNRFFEDVTWGVARLLEEGEDVITFIGSLLSLHDCHFRAIQPIYRPDVPKGTLTVIDGQQRLTVLTLVTALLHNTIQVAGKRSTGSQWLDDKRVECVSELERLLEEKMPVGEYPFFPRVIRAFDDRWAKSDDKRLYTSPLAHFTSSYCEFFRDSANAGKVYKHKSLPCNDENKRKNHKHFLRAVKRIDQLVQSVYKGNMSEFPEIKSIMTNQAVLSSLFNVEELPEGAFDSNNEKQAQVARVIVFASYVMHKIWFVSLTAMDENYAFDIFEALNTTGQVLTAYETFKPEIIRAEGVDKFEGSKSAEHTNKIGGYLDSLDKKNQKSKITGELLISFALAEDATILPKALREQRKYLRESYGQLKSISTCSDRHDFTRHLMHAAEVMQIWNREGSAKINELFRIDDSLKQEMETARFCLDFLKGSNHHIVRALIIRFYEAARLADGGQRQERIADLFSVVKALAAFYAIWRGSRESTDGIDRRHRTLMRIHYSRNMPADNLSVENVKRELVSLLKQGGNSGREILSKDVWVKYATTVPIYSTSRHITRFLLLVAAHNTLPKEDGLLEEARDGAVHPLITEDAWGKDDYATVEHIIPQNEHSTVGCEKGDLDRLGNLTLIPLKSNSMLSDRPWEEKKAIFRALSAETTAELESAKKADHFPAAHRGSKHLISERHLPMTRAVSKSLCDYPTFLKHTEDRANNLAELAWKRLAVEWLGFKE